MQHHERYQHSKRATLSSLASDLLLGCIKIFGGFLYHSHALIADGFHSFADVITDIMVLFAAKYSSQDADIAHPYGHQRIETTGTLMLSMFLVITGAGIAWDSCDEIIHQAHTMPGWPALFVAILSLLVNEGLFHYTRMIARRVNSALIMANAWHRRSDAASSLVVLIGILGSLLGVIYLDTIAAIIIGCMIIKMGWTYGWNSVKELIDTAVSPELITQIESDITNVHGVLKLHQLRSRMMGRDIYIDVHVQVAPFISVSEGHFIAQHVHHALMKINPDIRDVTVHIDPEDDEISQPCLHLKDRKSLEKTLLNTWQKDFPEIESWNLHYLDGHITIELILTAAFNQYSELQARINADLSQRHDIMYVQYFNKHSQEYIKNPRKEAL